MRIIVPKGAPRSSGAPSTPTTNPNNNTNTPSTNEYPRTTHDQPYASTLPSSVSIPHTSTRNSHGSRTSPPRDLGNSYSHEPGEAPRRRKQTKKHKSTSPNSTASYYNTADLDDGYNSSDEHGGAKSTPATSCGQGLIEEVSGHSRYHSLPHISLTLISYTISLNTSYCAK